MVLHTKWKGFKWERFKKNDVAVLQNALSSAKLSLNMASQCRVTSAASSTTDDVHKVRQDVRQIQEDNRRLRTLVDSQEREEVSRQQSQDDGEVASNSNNHQLWLRDNRLSIASFELPLRRVLGEAGPYVSSIVDNTQPSFVSGDSQTPTMVASEFSDSSTDVQIASPRTPVFGLPLAEAVNLYPPSDVNVCLPAVVYRCLEYLLAVSAENEEFVFLLGGSSGEVKTLKERFNTQGDVDLLSDGQYHDVHAVVSLLKLYLRELPTIVLTRKLSFDFSSASELKDQKYMTKVLSELVYRLPLPCFSLLRALSHYLSKVAKNSGRNKMTLHNLVIVLAPTLNIPTPILTVFIHQFDAVFDGQSASCSEIATVSGNSRKKAAANANSEPGFVPGLLSLRALYDFHKIDGSV